MVIITHKQGLPLSSVNEIPERIVKKLAEFSITTCEEFISAMHYNVEGYAKFLNMDKNKLLKLYSLIKKKLPNKVIEELEAPVKESFAYGAVSPYSKEFESYINKNQL